MNYAGPAIATCALICIGACFVLFSTPQNLPVVLPLLVLVSVGIVCWSTVRRRGEGSVQFFEIGVLYSGVVAIYALYPIGGFLANGLQHFPTNDNRLWAFRLSPEEVGRVAWLYTAYFVAFCAVYFACRDWRTRQAQTFQAPSRQTVQVAIGVYIALSSTFPLLGRVYDLSSETYAGGYLVLQQFPLVVQQLLNHLYGMIFTAQVVVLTALFCRYRRYRLIILGWIGLLAVLALARRGSRTELVLLLLCVAILYDYLVKPIRIRTIAFGALAGLAGFTALGMLRSGFTADTWPSPLRVFEYASEFETIFANAFDLNRLASRGMVAPFNPPNFYFADFFALVPQQILPVDKIAPADWYVSTYYPNYHASGGGFVFGAIAESVVGYGLPEAIVRGGLVGLMCAGMQRLWIRRGPSFWLLVLYVWTMGVAYQMFRNTTFSLVVLFCYRFVPLIAFVQVIARIAESSSVWRRRVIFSNA